MTSISVIIPCFNAEAFLAQTVRSVLNQTLAPIEIIVVDNGSSDRSMALARSFGDQVSVISEPRPGGPAARNAGAAAARGEALMFLDADDLLGPTALEALAAALSAAPEAVACCPWDRLEPAGDGWIAGPPSCAPRRRGQDDLAAWLSGWYHPPASVLWSKLAYERAGGWDPEVRVNQDGDLMMRGFIAGNRLVAAPGGRAYYRRPPPGHASVSSGRASRPGVESRLMVLNRIAGLLQERGRLDRYRAPLGVAYEAVAESCRDEHPDLHARCLEAAALWAEPAWRRRARRLPERLHAAAAQARWRAGAALSATAGARAAATAAPQSAPSAPAPVDGPRPKVSVIVPTYNRERVLQRALRSVLAQDFEDLELLVVDDASQDGTAAMVAALGDPRVRYLRQERNRGVAAARTRGLREARGEFIAFLDSDDEWLPGKLARQVALFQGRSGRLGLIYTGVEDVLGAGRRALHTPAHRGDVHQAMLARNVLHGAPSSALMRREVVATVGFFDEQMPAIEDYDYWVRITRFYEVDYIAAPLVRYYDEAPSALGHDQERRSLNFAGNMQARATFFERNRHEMRRAGVEHLFLLESAMRHLHSPYGSTGDARRLLLQALKARPSAVKVHIWILASLLPRRPRHLARRLVLGLWARRRLAAPAPAAQPS